MNWQTTSKPRLPITMCARPVNPILGRNERWLIGSRPTYGGAKASWFLKPSKMAASIPSDAAADVLEILDNGHSDFERLLTLGVAASITPDTLRGDQRRPAMSS